MSILPLAGLLTGSLLTIGIAVLVIIVLAIKRRHRHCPRPHCAHQLDPSKQPKLSPQPSRPGSMLEINTGDHRYVVAYTLKPVADCVNQTPVATTVEHQPDILNTPRGKGKIEVCVCINDWRNSSTPVTLQSFKPNNATEKRLYCNDV